MGAKASKPVREPLPRDVPKLLQVLRNFLLGRDHNSELRFVRDISKRTQPLPNLPPGPSNKLNDNYYYSRDARGEVQHPEELFPIKDESKPKLAPTDKWERCEVRRKGDAVNKVPGKTYDWDKYVK